jgi:hypothetical protein
MDRRRMARTLSLGKMHSTLIFHLFQRNDDVRTGEYSPSTIFSFTLGEEK